jgi:L-alanine-DL-glutamate epimerase-like enolase superfamily enzyme
MCAAVVGKKASVLQHDLNRVGGITAAQWPVAAAAGPVAAAAARRVPVSPHADQMQNRHLTMVNMNFRIVEHFPGFDVEE